jgi:hypothetical protein
MILSWILNVLYTHITYKKTQYIINDNSIKKIYLEAFFE